MKKTEHKIFYARNIQELFYHTKTITGLQIVGGCTDIGKLPEKSISSLLIPDLRQITRHERYLELGSGTTLAEAEELGEHHLPKVLYHALKATANPFVRNIATIGGNILADGIKHTLYAPLMALDSALEFQSQAETKIIPLQNFITIPEKYVLTKIRIPVNDWDISIFNRLGHGIYIKEDSASFAFLAGTEKSVITNIGIALGGKISFRCLELENRMLGTKLPLQKENMLSYMETAELSFDSHSRQDGMLKQQFMNLISHSLDQLT